MSAVAAAERVPMWPVIGQLVRRSVILVGRQPSIFVPSVIFPAFFVIAFGGAFSGLVLLPGFPTDHILNWFAPMAILQGAAFIGVGVGFGTTRDIETGFYDRFLTAPVPRAALLLGPALGAVVRCLLPFYIVLAGAALGGARLEGSALGALTLFVAAIGTSLLHAFWTTGLAYRLKTQRAAPLMQIGVFITIFLSTAQVPLSVMTGWLQPVARVNPMTQVLALSRAGFLGDVTWAETWPGIIVLIVLVGLALLWAARGLVKLVP